ncbi:TonB-dependent receptor [Iodidimonas nitroreducens]|uniref:TonB-dependent receptor n=2 Tax=Iodidimonas nitroreducens TaxID=1236968 RepID=A0A5A7N516_9PROT|nr:TonB-dependent receptor [Iodidimonas nitroreducens]
MALYGEDDMTSKTHGSRTARIAARGFLSTVAGFALLYGASAATGQAFAQITAADSEQAADQLSEREQSNTLSLEEIVVTGRPGGAGMKKLDASFAITTMNNDAINKFAPKSTADLLKAVPGVWAESSGGESGANIFVRGFPGAGDAEFVTIQVDGMPIFPPPTLSFLENSSLFRIDETVERMEALRGGPNPVFSNGQPGVTVNFIQKQGGPETEGILKLSGTDFGEKRVDVQMSGPLADDLFYSFGGFYRTSNGIRDAEFNSERGGQISANITKLFDNGQINVYTRFLDDRGAWLLPIPLLSDENGNIEEFPGFDRGTGNLIGNGNRLGVIETGRNGETRRLDLADGRGAETFMIGGSAEFEFDGGWTIREKFNYMSGDADTIGLVPANTPRTLGDILAGIDTNGVGGTFTFTESGEQITDLSQQALTAGMWSVEKDIESFTNDFSVAKDLFEGNTFTVGLYISDYSSNDLWFLGNDQLLAAEENARRIDLSLNDGTQVTRNGFIGAPFFDVNAAYNGRNIAAYFADEWQITPDLRIDAGFRIENQNVDATLENVDFGVDLDDDPTTLFNNNAAILNGSFRTINFDETETSWTIGANYNLNQDMAIFARVNNGQKFPQFDNLRDGADGIQSIDQYEVGLKASTDMVSVFATLFYNDFTGLPEQRFIDGENVVIISGSNAIGVEGEFVVRPFEGMSLALTGTWQDAEFDGKSVNDGNRVQRQPKLQLRFTPSYDIALPWGFATLYGTFTHVGDRFSDSENQQVLEDYQKLDAGVVMDVDNWTFQVTADNLTDSHGLTEGNPRVLGAQTGTAIFARPILGRSFRFSLSYNF